MVSPPQRRIDRGARIAHEDPQQRGAGEVEHGKADEERRVAHCEHEPADQQREDQEPGVAQRAGHAGTVATSLRLKRSDDIVMTVTDSV